MNRREDHHHECFLAGRCSPDEENHGFCGNSDFFWCMHCEKECICDRIERAEKRVRESEACLAVCAPPKTRALCCRPWDRNYQRGLESAREAVAALEPRLKLEKYKGGYDCCGCSTTYDLMEDALAAIDALKEKP